jgi:hypothetical protein
MPAPGRLRVNPDTAAGKRVLGRRGGMLEAGNIDMNTRPRVKNPDGSASTVRSISYNVDGDEVLMPTVPDEGGRIMSNDEALNRYKRTGRHLGKFSDPQSATAYAQGLHESEAAKLASAYDKTDFSKARYLPMWRDLSSRYPERQPYPGEAEFLRNNPDVTGMGTEDRKVVLNNASSLTPGGSVITKRNEQIRNLIEDRGIKPSFPVTAEQTRKASGAYKTDRGLLRKTILGRILAGDDSMGPYTERQRGAASSLADAYDRMKGAP